MPVLLNPRRRVFCAIALSLTSFGIVLHGQTRRPAAPAAAVMPQIVIGGIQVVKVAVTGADAIARPFNAENGTKIVLWVKMPAGQGLIEIDEDASVLQHFGDDKGTDLGGRLDSFPDEFKDGSGGTLDITSSGMPAAGATKLVAEGTLALNVSPGTKPQKVANVRLDDGRTFKLGATTITLAEVSADGEDQKFTLKLPRQVMESIKSVSFFDAKNQPLDGHRTSSGYFNDDAEMGLSVKTELKTVTLEFEIWQGLRLIKVPFKVSAGIGIVE